MAQVSVRNLRLLEGNKGGPLGELCVCVWHYFAGDDLDVLFFGNGSTKRRLPHSHY